MGGTEDPWVAVGGCGCHWGAVGITNQGPMGATGVPRVPPKRCPPAGRAAEPPSVPERPPRAVAVLRVPPRLCCGGVPLPGLRVPTLTGFPSPPPSPPHLISPRSKGSDPEYSVARGIDFQNVATVINFDVPATVESYIHRVGRCVGVGGGGIGGDRTPGVQRWGPQTPTPSHCRTARADNPGTALTFVLPEEREQLARIEDVLAGGEGGFGVRGGVWGGGGRPFRLWEVTPHLCVSSPPPHTENGESMLQPYKFCMEEIEALRYRCRVGGTGMGGIGMGAGGGMALP